MKVEWLKEWNLLVLHEKILQDRLMEGGYKQRPKELGYTVQWKCEELTIHRKLWIEIFDGMMK